MHMVTLMPFRTNMTARFFPHHSPCNHFQHRPERIPIHTLCAKVRVNGHPAHSITTSDPYINASVPAICAAADGPWDPPA